MFVYLIRFMLNRSSHGSHLNERQRFTAKILQIRFHSSAKVFILVDIGAERETILTKSWILKYFSLSLSLFALVSSFARMLIYFRNVTIILIFMF